VISPSVRRARELFADNRQTVGKLLLVALLMFGFGYTLVPIYRVVCTALGLNVLALSESQADAGAAAARNSQVDTSRTITVEFDANARGPWDFKPEQSSIDVHPGQVTTVMYSFHNRQNRAMTLQAIPSYAPSVAMAHFTKLECFCFSQQVLQAGESKRWPVVFVVDAKLPKDVRTITLSYTFFEVGGKVPAEPVAAAGSVAVPLS
jgi:cytochrome c oxidase assembly protein subunit 11